MHCAPWKYEPDGLTNLTHTTFLDFVLQGPSPRALLDFSQFCEGGVDVVGVVTPLVRGGAQVLHGDQVVELSVLLEVHEKDEEGEDGEGQIEVESERGELKERRTCTWMT